MRERGLFSLKLGLSTLDFRLALSSGVLNSTTEILYSPLRGLLLITDGLISPETGLISLAIEHQV